jgi:uncharacterized protein YcaQ
MPEGTHSPLRLSLDTACTLAVVKQGLHQRPPVADKDALLDTIHRIRLLQLDTISVVARSHYLVMLSRVGPYDPSDLDALLYPDRRLFEQWAHVACLIPVEDYACFAPVILARRDDPPSHWVDKRLGDDPEGTLATVLAEVRDRGPLASKDFEDPRGKRGTWWDWKPAKTALEVLFHGGHLMVERREGFQRYYDLSERVLPASAEPPAYSVEDYQRWAVLRSTSCLGVATAAQISDYYRIRKPIVRPMVQSLAEHGELLPLEVEGWKETAYLDPADLPLLEEIESGGQQPVLTAFLSPFDNLIWDRQRVLDLFGFAYRAEMYVPKAKRRYGYYVMPILHRGRLVGRLDPKADRKTNTLILRALYLEPDVPLRDDLVAGIAAALEEFMMFHDSQAMVLERSEPEELSALLLSHLSRLE